MHVLPFGYGIIVDCGLFGTYEFVHIVEFQIDCKRFVYSKSSVYATVFSCESEFKRMKVMRFWHAL